MDTRRQTASSGPGKRFLSRSALSTGYQTSCNVGLYHNDKTHSGCFDIMEERPEIRLSACWDMIFESHDKLALLRWISYNLVPGTRIGPWTSHLNPSAQVLGLLLSHMGVVSQWWAKANAQKATLALTLFWTAKELPSPFATKAEDSTYDSIPPTSRKWITSRWGLSPFSVGCIWRCVELPTSNTSFAILARIPWLLDHRIR